MELKFGGTATVPESSFSDELQEIAQELKQELSQVKFKGYIEEAKKYSLPQIPRWFITYVVVAVILVGLIRLVKRATG